MAYAVDVASDLMQGPVSGTLEQNIGLSSTFAVMTGKGNSLSASSDMTPNTIGSFVSENWPWLLGGAGVLLAIAVVIKARPK